MDAAILTTSFPKLLTLRPACLVLNRHLQCTALHLLRPALWIFTELFVQSKDHAYGQVNASLPEHCICIGICCDQCGQCPLMQHREIYGQPEAAHKQQCRPVSSPSPDRLHVGSADSAVGLAKPNTFTSVMSPLPSVHCL